MSGDALRIRERVELAVELGESHFREFKSALEGAPGQKQPRNVRDVCIDIGQTLVAFANADGGELLVGVEDDGTVSGVDYPEDRVSLLLNAPLSHVHKDTPLPAGRAARVEFDGKYVLYFSVPKSTNYVHLTSDGRCLQRKDRESVPMASERITFSRLEIASREYDRVFVDNATPADLDLQMVETVAQHVSKGMSPEKCLQHLELAEFDGVRLRLRRAALLLFAKAPSKWHPRLQVRVLRIDGTEIKSGEAYNVTKDEEVSACILRLIEPSWDLLRPHLTETRFSKDAIFRTQIIYPELACREALINAIAHRDYSMEGRGIEVHVYTDRLKIVSPGSLLSTIQIDDLKQLTGVHQSRNSLVARVLRVIGYMRELGEGIRRIHELMSSNDLAPPELQSESAQFSVTLYHKYIYSREEKVWLDSFASLNLSHHQKTVVRLGYNGHVVSPREIWEAVGIVDTDYYRQLVESLDELGVLYRVRSKQQVMNASKRKKIPKKQVPQFAICLPGQRPQEKPKEEVKDEAEYVEVFVGNLPPDVTRTELEEAFAKAGNVVNVEIPIHRESGRQRGFAFVEFERESEAKKALDLRGSIEIKGKKIRIDKSSR